jgi:hypothetical protein
MPMETPTSIPSTLVKVAINTLCTFVYIHVKTDSYYINKVEVTIHVNVAGPAKNSIATQNSQMINEKLWSCNCMKNYISNEFI